MSASSSRSSVVAVIGTMVKSYGGGPKKGVVTWDAFDVDSVSQCHTYICSRACESLP